MTENTILPIKTFSPEELHDRVHAALRAWEKVHTDFGDLLDDLLLFREAYTASSDQMEALPRMTTNQLLREAIDRLAEQSESHAAILRHRFISGDKLRRTAALLNLTIDQVRKRQRDAIEQLATILAYDESYLRHLRVHEVESTLPPSTYTTLFGFDEALDVLLTELLHLKSSWVLAIMGIGGIGKTALADALMRRAIRHFRFHEYVWLRVDPNDFDQGRVDFESAIDLLAHRLAEQIAPEVAGNAPMNERLIRVRQVLKETPHLIVIDNLETRSSTAYLMRQLQEWANPSKFLVTTRIRPIGEASIFSYTLDELNERDTAELIRHHALSIGQKDLAQATDSQAQYIYDAVGGNPLALKMVISLAATMPISLILDDLHLVHTPEVEELYNRIYQRAWMAITPVQRLLLQSMPLIAETGGTLTQLKAISGLADHELWPAINELVNRSLIELRGTTWDQSYGIHRLTGSFLQTNINRWEDDDDEDEELLV